ncbi:ABC transporter ATP-binding protein [Brevibacterium luteolum]|uniref:ABC transporter ATP-binding protein n=1 Tax=Brevibacterium luteolum TaxID=199591 RepID=UPI00223A6DCD|nr:ABC transporter ATP-binding protein [Brevibacterium luteolum]MCT1873726.1 ABC transporter ATP-binding protein [Brevibacterium luteolum]MCT1891162.1 ABC transporter ATP-binding protein [Brevibacterium luteolum]MCT1893657.1 ABC transporter ATP-binding protein [Brevibacterium luteolum]MCT1924451.1 ABC transporter ATP-binding protein [Brevibacterium luteolum]
MTTILQTTNTQTTAAASAPALELERITLTYPDGTGTVTALDDVSLTLTPGTVTAIVGPSGSGKSSLLAVGSTLVTPTSGVVRIDGTDVGRLKESERSRLRREKIGIVFQQPNLLESLTAVEQLIITDKLRGTGGGDDTRKRAEALLERVGLADAARRRPHQLSGGQRQRVNIARALMGDPSVLLVDEPTAALDHDRSEAIMDLLCQVTKEFGVATVIVTHDTEFLPKTDAVATMRDGKLSEPECAAAAAC